MNWWDILKVDPNLEQAGLNYQENLFGQGRGQTTFRGTTIGEGGQPAQPASNQPLPTQQPEQEQGPLLTETQLQNVSDPSLYDYEKEKTYNPVQQQQQTNTTQNIPKDSSGADDDSGADDTDVGTIRENVSRAKQNLTQLPRGPKALQITQILTDLSAAAIDPVNQKNIVVGAKKKLQDAFPQVA